ncbi:kinase-like protein [Thelephora ganbajun]|uniref:Kinase-like protein n=1 Tax=Thelephora ganbajun TaxID=370292 RepID=A0ACB6Z5T5_THEGA|nr:kinase-like protein [Thelephora ganbajun]
MVHSLGGDDAQTFADVIDEALETFDFSPRTRKKYLKALYRTCGRNAILPKSLRIPLCYDRQGIALFQGGFADVWKGKHCGRDVAVKVIRAHSYKDLQRMVGRFCKEVVTWESLRHPNVLPLLGVTMNEYHFAMVSEWMENGNINEFVKANPDADRLGLLVDVARGLIYIHGQDMIHGDLKGANILIDQTRHARIADFGLLTVVSDSPNQLSSNSHTQGGTVRWMSPELVDPKRFGFEISRPTESSDCYALGMVIYEAISGHFPFHKHADLIVFLKVLDGNRPSREVGFVDGLWEMLELCWESQPSARPSIEDVLQCLERVSNSSNSLSPEVDKDTEDGDDWDSASDFSDTGLPPPNEGDSLSRAIPTSNP